MHSGIWGKSNGCELKQSGKAFCGGKKTNKSLENGLEGWASFGQVKQGCREAGVAEPAVRLVKQPAGLLH